MSRLRHVDILVELIDLCRERMDEVRQQLVYYRASVYKGETAGVIGGQIDQLKVLGDLFGDEALLEAFSDFEAMAKAGAMLPVPGECSLSKRVTHLLATLDHHLGRVGQAVANKAHETATGDDPAFADAVRKHRDQLLALCRHGSRQWAFFQAL